LGMFTAPGAYDRAITVFSPDGRLFQVEYALETVRRGSTVLGITCPEGVVLAAEERTATKLQDRNFLWKLFKIDDHIGVAISGLSSDARILVDQARIFSQSNKLTYDEPVDVEILSKRVGDIMQVYTQHAGVRPFGVSMLLGGVDKVGSKLFQTDPSGACWSYKAFAIGAGGEAVREILEQEYHEDMKLEEAISLAIKCLSKVIEGQLDSEKVRIAIIPVDTMKFTWISGEELDKYLEKAIE
jgi:proteasome alpha subunit